MAKKQKLDPGSSDIQEGLKNATPPSHHHDGLRLIEQKITSSNSPPVSMEFQEGTVCLYSSLHGWTLRSLLQKVERPTK